jgi:TPR repeat protein
MSSHIENVIQKFHMLVGQNELSEADEAAYNVVVVLGMKTPKPIIDHLFDRTPDQSWLKDAPVAGLAMAVMMSHIENDRASQGTSAQFYMSCMSSQNQVVSARAHFHIAEMMLKDPKPSPLLRSRIESCLTRAIEMKHPEAAMLLGTLYAHGTLADDGKPDPEGAVALYVKAIEEFHVDGAKRLLLALMEKFGTSVDGYDLASLRGQAGMH